MADSENAAEWLTFAEMDLSSAEFLLNHRPLPKEIICFHCQQAAEKALKGQLLYRKIRPPKIHDLLELSRLNAQQGVAMDALVPVCGILNKYSTQPRYPQELVIEQEDVTEAIRSAKTVVSFVKDLLNEH